MKMSDEYALALLDAKLPRHQYILITLNDRSRFPSYEVHQIEKQNGTHIIFTSVTLQRNYP